MEEMWFGGLPLHAAEEFVIKNVTLIDPPLDSSIRYVVGYDHGVDGWATMTMAYIVPDGYWPPVNTIFEWCERSRQRSERRREREYQARLYRTFVLLALLGIFWIVYGADKVLG